MSEITTTIIDQGSINDIVSGFLGGMQTFGMDLQQGILSQLSGGDLGRLGLAGAGGLAGVKTVSGLTNLLISNKGKIADLSKMLAEKGLDIGVQATDIMYKFGKFGDDYYGKIQETFGGIQDIDRIFNKTSKNQVETLESITGIFYNRSEKFDKEIKALTVTTATSAKREVNALTAYFEDSQEVVQNYSSVFDSLRYTQTLRINEMQSDQKAMLGTFSKGFAVSNSEIAGVLERTISLTGEASTDIFNRISNFSKAVSDQTGIDFKNISQNVIALINDVNTFGNIHEDAAARIAGALGQIGLSYSGFSGMVSKFQGFDSAAGSLGNLTTVFGVHFDAMEMMMLANEDQEEFLYRMRDAFLETGRSIEDMTLAEKKLAAQEIGMSVQDFENFMRGEREISDMTAATAEASQLSMATGFETMTQQMRLIQRDSDDSAEYMRKRFFNTVTRDAINTSNRLSLLFHGLLKVTPDVADEVSARFRAGLSSAFQSDRASKQRFEDIFFDEAMLGDSKALLKDSAAFQAIQKEFFSKDAVLDYTEIGQKLYDLKETLKPGEAQAIILAAISAQELSFVKGQKLVAENRKNIVDMEAAAIRSRKATLNTAMYGMLGEGESDADIRFNVEDEAFKTALLARIEAKKTEADGGASDLQDMKEELAAFVTQLKDVTAGAGVQEITLKTTGPEARKFQEILEQLLDGIYVDRKHGAPQQ